MKLGDTMLELLYAPSAVEVAPDWRVGARLIAIEVKDMDGEIERLKNLGVEIFRPPVMLGASKRAEIKDPDGIKIELREYLS